MSKRRHSASRDPPSKKSRRPSSQQDLSSPELPSRASDSVRGDPPAIQRPSKERKSTFKPKDAHRGKEAEKGENRDRLGIFAKGQRNPPAPSPTPLGPSKKANQSVANAGSDGPRRLKRLGQTTSATTVDDEDEDEDEDIQPLNYWEPAGVRQKKVHRAPPTTQVPKAKKRACAEDTDDSNAEDASDSEEASSDISFDTSLEVDENGNVDIAYDGRDAPLSPKEGKKRTLPPSFYDSKPINKSEPYKKHEYRYTKICARSAHFLARCHNFMVHPHEVLFEGHKLKETDSVSGERRQALVKLFEDAIQKDTEMMWLLKDADHEEYKVIAEKMHAAAGRARSQDVSKMKRFIREYVKFPITTLDNGKQVVVDDGEWGFKNETIAELLAPVAAGELTPEMLEDLERGILTFKTDDGVEHLADGTEHMGFMFEGRWTPERGLDGFLRSDILVKSWLCMFIAPLTARTWAEGKKVSSPPSISAAFVAGLTSVPPGSIAYICAVVYCSLLHVGEFSSSYGTIYEDIFNTTMGFFEAEAFKERAAATLQWWNRNIFPRYHKSKTLKAGGSLARYAN